MKGAKGDNGSEGEREWRGRECERVRVRERESEGERVREREKVREGERDTKRRPTLMLLLHSAELFHEDVISFTSITLPNRFFADIEFCSNSPNFFIWLQSFTAVAVQHMQTKLFSLVASKRATLLDAIMR